MEDFSIFAENFGESASSLKPAARLVSGKNDALLLLKVLPETSPGKPGLRVCLDGVSDLEGYLLKLHYDKGKIRFLRAERTDGGMFGGKGRALPLLVKSSNGELIIADVVGNGAPFHGDNTLVELHFEGRGGFSGDDFKVEMTVLDQDHRLLPVSLKDISRLPEEFSLLPNYPNPFNAFTTIGYILPRAAPVRLAVYNMLGREVAVLVDKVQPAGHHQVVWDASNMASGIYLIRLRAEDFTRVEKAVLLR